MDIFLGHWSELSLAAIGALFLWHFRRQQSARLDRSMSVTVVALAQSSGGTFRASLTVDLRTMLAAERRTDVHFDELEFVSVRRVGIGQWEQRFEEICGFRLSADGEIEEPRPRFDGRGDGVVWVPCEFGFRLEPAYDAYLAELAAGNPPPDSFQPMADRRALVTREAERRRLSPAAKTQDPR